MSSCIPHGRTPCQPSVPMAWTTILKCCLVVRAPWTLPSGQVLSPTDWLPPNPQRHGPINWVCSSIPAEHARSFHLLFASLHHPDASFLCSRGAAERRAPLHTLCPPGSPGGCAVRIPFTSGTDRGLNDPLHHSKLPLSTFSCLERFCGTPSLSVLGVSGFFHVCRGHQGQDRAIL